MEESKPGGHFKRFSIAYIVGALFICFIIVAIINDDVEDDFNQVNLSEQIAGLVKFEGSETTYNKLFGWDELEEVEGNQAAVNAFYRVMKDYNKKDKQIIKEHISRALVNRGSGAVVEVEKVFEASYPYNTTMTFISLRAFAKIGESIAKSSEFNDKVAMSTIMMHLKRILNQPNALPVKDSELKGMTSATLNDLEHHGNLVKKDSKYFYQISTLKFMALGTLEAIASHEAISFLQAFSNDSKVHVMQRRRAKEILTNLKVSKKVKVIKGLK